MKLKLRPPAKARIEMIPLIDCFFLVLVYFVYSFLAMSVNQGIPLTLPQATAAAKQKIEHHGVSVNTAGEFYLDKEKMDVALLQTRLQELKENEKDLQIFIYGDKFAPHGQVVVALNAVKQAGIGKVYIETEGNDADA